jgi:hypothetical protein
MAYINSQSTMKKLPNDRLVSQQCQRAMVYLPTAHNYTNDITSLVPYVMPYSSTPMQPQG